jgi:hypothetical protein
MGILESLGIRRQTEKPAVVKQDEDAEQVSNGGDKVENTINQRRIAYLDANGEVKLPKDAFAVFEHVVSEKATDNGMQTERVMAVYYSYLVPVAEEEPAPKEEPAPAKPQAVLRRR